MQQKELSSAKYILGIDLGGTFIKAGLFNQQGTLLEKTELMTAAAAGSAVVVEQLVQAGLTLLERTGLQSNDLLGLGIGAPGNIDSRTGMVHYSPNLAWRQVPLKNLVEDKIAVPVFVDNDANAAALGEHWQGAGQGTQHMIMITVGTGVGGGLILGGRLYRGASGSAGEIGHTILLEDGPRCNCGVQGHLEALTSAPWMVRAAKAAITQGQASTLSEIVQLEAKQIFEAAQTGDQVAQQVVTTTAKYLGMGLANLVNIFNPELIIIGGGVAKAGEQLLGPIRAKVAELALQEPASRVSIVAAKLGNDAGCYGAAALVLHES